MDSRLSNQPDTRKPAGLKHDSSAARLRTRCWRPGCRKIEIICSCNHLLAVFAAVLVCPEKRVLNILLINDNCIHLRRKYQHLQQFVDMSELKSNRLRTNGISSIYDAPEYSL